MAQRAMASLTAALSLSPIHQSIPSRLQCRNPPTPNQDISSPLHPLSLAGPNNQMRGRLQITGAKNVYSERKGVTVSAAEPEMTAEGLAEYEMVLSKLGGTQPDFWEGPQWNTLGFVVQYMWAVGIVVALVACVVAVRTFNSGATDIRSTAVYKESLKEQSGGFEEDSGEPSVFGESLEEAPPVQK